MINKLKFKRILMAFITSIVFGLWLENSLAYAFMFSFLSFIIFVIDCILDFKLIYDINVRKLIIQKVENENKEVLTAYENPTKSK